MSLLKTHSTKANFKEILELLVKCGKISSKMLSNWSEMVKNGLKWLKMDCRIKLTS